MTTCLIGAREKSSPELEVHTLNETVSLAMSEKDSLTHKHRLPEFGQIFISCTFATAHCPDPSLSRSEDCRSRPSDPSHSIYADKKKNGNSARNNDHLCLRSNTGSPVRFNNTPPISFKTQLRLSRLSQGTYVPSHLIMYYGSIPRFDDRSIK